MKFGYPSTNGALFVGIFLVTVANFSYAAGGRCNVTVRPSSVQSAVDHYAANTKKVCLNKLGTLSTDPKIRETQEQGCRDEAQREAENFRRNVIQLDREKVNPEGDKTARNDRVTPRPRGHEQSMSRCGGGNGDRGPERPSLMMIRRAIRDDNMTNGQIACFCRNDTQAAQRARNTEEGLKAVRAPAAAELPQLPPALRAPAAPAPAPARRPNGGAPLFMLPWHCLFGCAT